MGVGGRGRVEFARCLSEAGAGDPWKFHVPTTELVDLQVTWPTRPDAVFGEVEEAVIRVKGRMMAVGLRDAETTMGAHFDDPDELMVPETVMACVAVHYERAY